MAEVLDLEIAPGELERGAPTAEHLTAAVEALRRDGLVVLSNVIDCAHLNLLRERMLADLPIILGRTDAPFNFNRGNIQQDAPPFPPYLFRDLLVNDIVAAVTHALLGPGLFNDYYSGNTALPSDVRQPVHPDVAQLWPNLEHAPPAFGCVVNVPLVDVSVENGSTELWPGSHLDTTLSLRDGTLQLPVEAVERRREVAPPLQPTVRLGSVLVRDIRLWHAGMPNRTDQPRPMLAMIHYIHWWKRSRPLPFAKGSEPFFEHPLLATNARFVEGEIDYLHHNSAYDFEE
jgi:hypothetical protein